MITLRHRDLPPNSSGASDPSVSQKQDSSDSDVNTNPVLHKELEPTVDPITKEHEQDPQLLNTQTLRTETPAPEKLKDPLTTKEQEWVQLLNEKKNNVNQLNIPSDQLDAFLQKCGTEIKYLQFEKGSETQLAQFLAHCKEIENLQSIN